MAQRDNKYEIFNEFCITLASHLTSCFFDPSDPEVFVDAVGWILVALALSNLMFDVGVIVW